jgi:DNA-binding GntR family transcriptional regulator
MSALQRSSTLSLRIYSQPFREAVITGLLDPEQSFDLKALAEEWGDCPGAGGGGWRL